MPSDRDMHDFYNRTPGTPYGEYRTWVADGGPKSTETKTGGFSPKRGGSETTGAALWAFAVSMVAAFCLLNVLGKAGYIADQGAFNVLILAAFVCGFCVLIAYMGSWLNLPIYLFCAVALGLMYGGWPAAIMGSFFVTTAFAVRWAPVVYIGERRPGVLRVARWASYLSWGVLAATICLLGYLNFR